MGFLGRETCKSLVYACKNVLCAFVGALGALSKSRPEKLSSIGPTCTDLLERKKTDLEHVYAELI